MGETPVDGPDTALEHSDVDVVLTVGAYILVGEGMRRLERPAYA